ncbi:MAG: hypothetical protein H7A44_04585 [Opitutaceae bacterium]|nr:hypothetical protein [Opitutaceae bacterium]
MSTTIVQLTGIAGVLITLTAVWLQWTLPGHIARLEDKLKDGRLNAKQVEQRIRWTQLAPIVCTLLGTCLLFGAVLRALGR